MGGLGFIHLGFLAAGLAVAVPIVIHLLFRQRARRVEIGTIHILRLVLRDQARRRKIRRWLLLALRAAAMGLLALLFARPYWNRPEAPGEDQQVVLLIDRSASMAAGPAGSSVFDQAQARAQEILQGVPTGATVDLAYCDAQEVRPARVGQIDRATKPGLAGTDFTKALEWARDKVIASRRKNSRVYLLTDLQRAGVRARLTDPWPPNADVEIIDVGRPLTRNLAAEDVQAEETDLRAGKPLIVTARVLNAGLFPVRNVTVRLSLDGQPPIAQTVAIEGRSRQIVRFEAPVRQPGLYHGFVEVVGKDDLSFDDRRFLAFEARPPDRVLVIDGEPGGSVYGNETYYLEMALRLRLPGEESTASPTPYEPVRQAWTSADAALPELGSFRVVALCNVEAISAADADKLSRFVSSGGGLIIFTGEHLRPGALEALDRAKLLPARIEEPANAGFYRFADWIKDHPILSPFADPQYGDLRTLRFRKIVRLVPGPQARVPATRPAGDARIPARSASEGVLSTAPGAAAAIPARSASEGVLATAPAGEPLIVEKAIGQGRCIMFAFPADNAWGDWVIHRLYVPLVHQLFGYLTGRLPETRRVRFDSVGPGPDQAPGIVVDNGRALVRNVDPAESEIERTTAKNLREVYRLPDSKEIGPRKDRPPETLAAGGERPDELWRSVAWALLIVLVAETFVANRTYA
jgi:Aerotolerance regulator N-terminal